MFALGEGRDHFVREKRNAARFIINYIYSKAQLAMRKRQVPISSLSVQVERKGGSDLKEALIGCLPLVEGSSFFAMLTGSSQDKREKGRRRQIGRRRKKCSKEKYPGTY